MTYQEFIDDVLVALGATHDDALWYRDGLLQNVIYCENKLVTQSLNNDLGPASDGRSASHQLEVVVVPVTYQQQPTSVQWAHLYFDLPSEVYDLPHDKGVSFVRYWRPSLPVSCPPSVAGATFTGTTIASLSAIYGHRHMSPNESRPYFARAKAGSADRVYLFGVSPLVTSVMVGLYSAPNFAEMALSDQMRIEPHKMYALRNMVMGMAVWPLGMPQERLKNDGRDFEPQQVLNMRQPISLNNPAVLEEPGDQ